MNQFLVGDKWVGRINLNNYFLCRIDLLLLRVLKLLICGKVGHWMIVVGAIQKTLPRLRNGEGELIFGAYLSYKTAIRRKQ